MARDVRLSHRPAKRAVLKLGVFALSRAIVPSVTARVRLDVLAGGLTMTIDAREAV